MEKKNDAITSQEEDFAQWYTDICKKAELMDYSEVKGFIIYKPYAYKMWELIQDFANKEFAKLGIQNVYFPLVIPTSLFQKEKDHIKGFAPETLIANIGGQNELTDPLIIRPTSEVLFTSYFAKAVNSYRDLPIKLNQWCSVVRWEKTTRPFLRGSEFLWQETHTVHETPEEAKKLTLDALDTYIKVGKELLAVPFVFGEKTPKEKFAGAENTYTIEALMKDGKALQSGTTHYFGDGFTKAFEVKFLGKDGKQSNPYQTSFGFSTRLLGAVIMVHGDDNGLVLPPRVAPIQVVIIPIAAEKDPKVLDKCKEIKKQLETVNLRVKLDDSSNSAGWKFSEYEMKGVPLRIELGPKDLANNQLTIATRFNYEKNQISLNENLSDFIPKKLDEIHDAMYKKAEDNLKASIHVAKTYDELKKYLDQGGYVKTMWCEDVNCEEKIKKDFQATSRCMPFDQTPVGDTCPVCGKKGKKVIYWAKAY